MSALDLTAAVEAAAEAMADDWNPERDPILTAMFRDYASSAIRAALPLILAQVEATDERIAASEAVAKHPALASCYDEERPLLDAMLDRLTALHEIEQAVTELAPAPVKPSRDELLRAIGDTLADSWSDAEEYAEAPDAITDAVLALLPGKTEQEVREEIAAEIEREGFFLARVQPAARDHCEGYNAALTDAARIARGGAR